MKKEQQSVSQHIGERLDFFCNTPNVASRSQAQKIIAAGLVFVNQKKILLKDYKLQKKDTVCFSFLEPIQLEPVKSPLEIHYEDESLLVVYKPAGLIVHPASSHQKISFFRMSCNFFFYRSRFYYGISQTKTKVFTDNAMGFELLS